MRFRGEFRPLLYPFLGGMMGSAASGTSRTGRRTVKMRQGTIVVTMLLMASLIRADDTNLVSGAEPFVRQVVQSLIEEPHAIRFEMADKLFTLDNGEVLSKEDLKRGWPEFAEKAITRTVTLDEFFRDVRVRVYSPRDNQRLMSNKRVLDAYRYQEGDLYCDASQVKDGVANFIGYEKAFVFVIRKIDGKWTLLGIGG